MDRIGIDKLKDIERHPRGSKMEQLSGVMIIIIIGGGVLTFVMLFIFAKRQIMRFTLRSRRGPHVPVGNDAKKVLRREIERRLDCIQKIAQEPRLLWTDDKYILQPDQSLPPYYYRMQAVDDIKLLEKEITRSDGSTRHAYESLRAFLLNTLAAAMDGSGQRMIHQFCDMYEHARHDPTEFGSEEYEAYHRLLLKLIEAAKQLRNYANSRKSSPSRLPKKQTKMQSLLDPSRLRPPSFSEPDAATAAATIQMPPNSGALASGTHSKVNLTLGLQRDYDCGVVDNPPSLNLKPACGPRDTSGRNYIKPTTLRTSDQVNSASGGGGDDEIMNISSAATYPVKGTNVV